MLPGSSDHPVVTPQHYKWPVRVVKSLLAAQLHNNFQCLVHVKGNHRRGLLFVSTPPENLGGYKFKESRGKTVDTQWMFIQDTRTNREGPYLWPRKAKNQRCSSKIKYKMFQILCFVDRASRYICAIKTNLTHNLSSVYFVSQLLRVSDIITAHHQEVHCIYTTAGTCCALRLTVFCQHHLPGQQTVNQNAQQQYQLLYIYTVYLQMMGCKYTRNM